MTRCLSVVLALLAVTPETPGQRRSPREPMTPWERKKLESFEDRDDPYRPAWLGRRRFGAIEALRDEYPFDQARLRRKEEEHREFLKRYDVVQAADQGTLFVYDQRTRRLAFVVEYRRRGRRVVLKRWVRYHPSFTSYTITDLKQGDDGEPVHVRSVRYVRTSFHATSRGELITGSGPFRQEASNRKALWLRDGELFSVLRLLDVPAGPTLDDNDKETFGTEPYRPLWASDIPFARLRRLGGRLPVKTTAPRPNPLERVYELRIPKDRNTLLVYDRSTRLLAYLMEVRPSDSGSRRRLVAYHPSFSAYTVYDVHLNAIKRPVHRTTTHYARKDWKVSPRNKRKVDGEGPFVRREMVAGGTVDFGSVVWQLLSIDP